jgi:GT2 family glycosyltransferase
MIPKIIHQIWIGDKAPPTTFMKTWKEKHPDFEYILWNETELMTRQFNIQCSQQIQDIPEINGKADIIRWEILYEYGGYFVDADSICIEPFDDYFENIPAFATFENENVRKGLVATGTMGFIPKHPLCYDIIQWIKHSPDAAKLIQETRAWYSVGPGLLTNMLDTGKYTDFVVFPSHCFLPVHFTGPSYNGHKKVYAYQEWGTAKQNYDIMNTISLPGELLSPSVWYSVFITSYNTPYQFISECLESIKRQEGYFGIEVVWIDDGSTDENSLKLMELLKHFKNSSRFIKYIYQKNETNMGLAISSNIGMSLCSSELVFKMDSDDIMMPHRMSSQIQFMNLHANAVLCGANIRMFHTKEDKKYIVNDTAHPERITWDDLHRTKISWYMNHPTICFRKSAINAVGNYNNTYYLHEDYDLFARLLRKYGVLYNLQEILVLYRLHDNQLTYKLDANHQTNIDLRRTIIENAYNHDV